ncbi:regulator of G-protein signaling 7-like [Planoprotostelium fungivorum]|uniref:Regulator of G-protein signaling 7-like n=1 Tax=Planoprotostelium fungivorum TaxID=1890364 RepID=A0A2P6NL78_9EUKA|nr:regulator of G-protein signaling 7-like [Planoprotostelium fungivorum]
MTCCSARSSEEEQTVHVSVLLSLSSIEVLNELVYFAKDEDAVLATMNHLALTKSINRLSTAFGFKPKTTPEPFNVENELKRVLANKESTTLFHSWCEAFHCAENVRFWIDVETVRMQPSSEKFERIYSEYLTPSSEYAINVDSSIIKDCEQKKPWSSNSFDEVQHQVFLLMASCSATRFLNSDVYKNYLNGEKERRSPKSRLFRRKNKSTTIVAPRDNVEALFRLRNTL